MMYKLIEEASKVLRTPPPEFDFENPPEDPKEIAKNLSEAMDKFGGLGLSANQVGLPYRLFIMKTMHEGDKEPENVAYFNPELTRVSQETELLKEGCLSFPDIFLMIKRSKTIEFKYQDVDGKEQTAVLEGVGARCVQHEIDHLNGILFLQRASKLKIERALKSRSKVRKKRLEYEKRIELARYFQQLQAKNDSKSDVDGEMSGTDKVSQES
jgi:peptide deformylase